MIAHLSCVFQQKRLSMGISDEVEDATIAID